MAGIPFTESLTSLTSYSSLQKCHESMNEEKSSQPPTSTYLLVDKNESFGRYTEVFMIFYNQMSLCLRSSLTKRPAHFLQELKDLFAKISASLSSTPLNLGKIPSRSAAERTASIAAWRFACAFSYLEPRRRTSPPFGGRPEPCKDCSGTPVLK